MPLNKEERRLAEMFKVDPRRMEAGIAHMRKNGSGRSAIMAVAGQPNTDDDDTGLFDEIDDNATAADIAKAGREHLDRYLAAPDERDAHEHLARASAMMAAALSRCARDNENVSRISRGGGLAS
ncbi:MAG: hypothetical protein WA993_11195 [Candidatus Binatus sp.]|jgi:hypothetical protein|uniref:hypothetical protein n=1 Tax=Candidatus Binatus sp. TaxID=2811406 RepID=UPI003CABFD42